jgi:hypothetical protein
MKKIFWKAYLYAPAVILLCFIIYVGGPKFETLDDRGLILLAAFSGALSGFFHVYVIAWEKAEENVKPYGPIIRYCLLYRPPIAMAFTLLCNVWLFDWFRLIREQIPALAPVSVVTIGLLLGSFSYWILKLPIRVLKEMLRPRMPRASIPAPDGIKPLARKTIGGFEHTFAGVHDPAKLAEAPETAGQNENSYQLIPGGETMDVDYLEKKEEQGITLSLKNRLLAAGGFWEWLKLLVLGYYLLIIPVILVFFIIDFWPIKDNTNAWLTTTLILKLNISFHLRMMLLIIMAGALGSYIHVATSFSYHIARRDFEPHWYWWYWMRLPIGAALALVLIMIIDGGIFVTPYTGGNAAPTTSIGIAALIGLFSRHLLEKFRDIFDVILHPREK